MNAQAYTSAERFRPAFDKVASGETLTEEEAAGAFNAIMEGGIPEVQLAGFLVAMKARGETVDEIAGAVRAMRACMRKVAAPEGAIDVVGTGGDAKGTYNISTATAFVLAGAGVPVAKHGNRAVSSKSGAADVLENLGVNLAATPEEASRALNEAGVTFLFAPAYHPAMRHAAPVRQGLKLRTIFNLLGPLSNPAEVKRQLVGVFAPQWVVPLAEVLQRLGADHVWVVHGADGLDELSTTGESLVAELKDGKIREFTVSPGDAEVPSTTLPNLLSGTPIESAEAMRLLLAGKDGPFRDIVLLNAAAALLIAGKARTLAEGAAIAAESLDKGHARVALERTRRHLQNRAMTTILAKIADYKHQEIAKAKAAKPLALVEEEARAAPPVRPFGETVAACAEEGRHGLIAEIKKASPSRGLIREDFDPASLAMAYATGGAACLSVLTDGPSFQGDPRHLIEARDVCALPVLRKDFMLDPYQVPQSRALGADCILIIMAAVDDFLAMELAGAANNWGMDVLVEVHDEEELDRALSLPTSLIGINNRDLKTFETSLDVTRRLIPRVPASHLVVSESGIFTHADIEAMSAIGAHAFLVGESLMRERDVAAATRRLLGLDSTPMRQQVYREASA